MSGLEILGIVASVLAVLTAALLGAADTALTRIGLARAESLSTPTDLHHGDKPTTPDDHDGPSLLRRVLEQRELMVATLFFVSLACHLGLATIVALLAHRWWGATGVIVAFVVELLVVFVAVGVPRVLALVNLNGVAPFAAGLVRAIAAIAPLRWIAGVAVAGGHRFAPDTQHDPTEVSEEELLALAEQAADSESIDEGEREYIASIIEFGDTIARQVMSPRPDMVAVAHDVRIVDVADVVIANGYSRIPVFTETIDDIVGIAHSKDLMRWQRDGKGDQPVSAIMRKPNMVPETKQISKLLREMQAETFHIAIVVDEYGGTAGLLTMEDLIEELVGEIVDEFDVEAPMIERLLSGEWRVNGKAELDDLSDLLETDLPTGEWSTVGGFIFSELGHVPEEREAVEVDGFRFLVERMQGRRIARVRVSPTTTTSSQTLDTDTDAEGEGSAPDPAPQSSAHS